MNTKYKRLWHAAIMTTLSSRSYIDLSVIFPPYEQSLYMFLRQALGYVRPPLPGIVTHQSKSHLIGKDLNSRSSTVSRNNMLHHTEWRRTDTSQCIIVFPHPTADLKTLLMTDTLQLRGSCKARNSCSASLCLPLSLSSPINDETVWYHVNVSHSIHELQCVHTAHSCTAHLEIKLKL